MTDQKNFFEKIVCIVIAVVLSIGPVERIANAEKNNSKAQNKAITKPTNPSAKSTVKQGTPQVKQKLSSAKKVIINFNEADIKVFIKFMSELTGKNYIVDDKVKGKVTVISPKEGSMEEAMKVFESTLQVYGYTLLSAGEVIKVIPTSEAKRQGPYY